MRLVIHVGLNKAASTWLQKSLASSIDSRLYFKELDSYFDNHYVLCNYLLEGKYDIAVEWINEYCCRAKKSGAQCAIISSEDIWQLLPFDTRVIDAFDAVRLSLNQSHNIETRYLILKRDFTAWAYSYMMQLVRNSGGFSRTKLFDIFESEITICRFPVIAAQALPEPLVDIVSIDNCNLADRLSSLYSISIEGNLKHENKSPKNETYLDVLRGSLRVMYAFSKKVHPNSLECDKYIDAFGKKFTNIFENAVARKESGEIIELFNEYDGLFSEMLVSSIVNLKNRMSDEDKNFWL